MTIAVAIKPLCALVLLCLPVIGLAAPVNSGLHLPDVACRYEMTITPTNPSEAKISRSWFFWRIANMVQTLDSDGGHGEIWQRTATDNIQYRKLYHADKTAVEYMPADNAANNMNFNWLKLATMFTQQELDALKPMEKTQMLGHSAELRKGVVDGQQVELVWLMEESLPASIIRKDGKRTIELRLVDIAPLSATQRKPVSINDIANYRQIDAIDFGDMENDPFVKKLMAADGHHHH